MMFLPVLFLHFSLGWGLDFLKLFFFASSYLYFKVGKGSLSSGIKTQISKKTKGIKKMIFQPKIKTSILYSKRQNYEQIPNLDLIWLKFVFQLCSFSSFFLLPPLLSKLSAPSCGLNKSIKMNSLTLNSNQP